MKKNLRLFLVAALAMVSFNAMAEDVIWSEDFSSFAAGDVPSSETYNYVCAGGGTKVYDGTMYAGGSVPELLIAKNGGAISATIDVSGKSGDATLQWKSNNKNIRPRSEDVALSQVTDPESGTTRFCTFSLSGKTTITITFSNTTASNGRIDDIKLYIGESTLSPAGIEWSPKTATVTIGADDNVFPTLTNPNNLTVTYSSSKEEIATINENGVVTIVAAGTTVITASFAGNDSFEAANATYTLTVKAAIDPDAKGQINNPYTTAEALEAIIALGEGKTASDPSYTNGTVVTITEISETNKNATFTISDDGTASSTVTVFRAKGLGKEDITSADYLKAGDKVTICGKLQYYKSGDNLTPEISSGYIYSLNGSTGIEAVKANAKFDGKMYNVAGQLVNKGYKGLVIMNGKKFVNK